MTEGTVPTGITLHQKSRVLEIAFSDGRSFRLPYEYLRVYSPSAEVRGHGPGQEVLQTGKQRGTVRGPLVRGGPLQRQVEHGRDDPSPESAPRPAARHPADRWLYAELAQQLERVAQGVGHAFEHRPHERAAVVSKRQTDERAPRIRVRVRCALARNRGASVRPRT